MPTKPDGISRLAAVCLLAVSLAGCGGDSGAEYQFDPADPVYPKFSGEKAYEQVEKLVAFGPRPAGSAAIEESRLHIEQLLAKSGWQTLRQAFDDEIPNGLTVNFVNVRARFGDADDTTLWDQPRAILVGSHIDTKRFSDFEFVGANDSGSSTGALLEIARVAAEKPEFAKQLELVFFDGEEAFKAFEDEVDGIYGSRYYAKTHIRRLPQNLRPKSVVILDMIGEKDLTIRIPSDTPPRLAEALFAASEELGHRKYFGFWRTKIIDDHVPFALEGIDAIDIIDFDFRAWHTSRDTLDQIDPKSLEIVGQTTLLFIEKHLLGDGAKDS